MSAWRYRKCPSCGKVRRAGDFKALDLGARWGAQLPARRQCPCGYVGPTHLFAVVREKHSESRQSVGGAA